MIEQYWDALKVAAFNAVWGVNVATLSPAHAYAVRTIRLLHMLVREFANGELNQRAASLVFTTLLSLVPLLAVSFSLLKAFGVHNRLEDVLLNFLAPLGEQGIEISNRIIGFVENVNGRVLGGIGLILLIVTVVSLLHKIERAFNHTWRIMRPRSFFERFSGYLSVVLVGPLLVFTALGVTTSVMTSEAMQSLMAIGFLGAVARFLTSLVPYLLVIAAFTFVYVFIPNTKVKIPSAVIGAVVAGVLWESAGWGFASFVTSSPKYAAIYSSFAVAFLFMLWLYVAWLILLVGNTVAFYHQHPEYQGLLAGQFRLSNRMRERMVFSAVFRIAQHHLHGLPPVPTAAIARELHVPLEPLEHVLGELQKQGLLLEVRGPMSAFVPARDLGTIRVADLWDAVRRAYESRQLASDRLVVEPAAEAIVDRLESLVATGLGEQTLRALVEPHPPVRGDVTLDLEAANAIPIESARRDREVGD